MVDYRVEPGNIKFTGKVLFTDPENVNTVSASGASQALADVGTATVHDVTLTANCALTFPSAAGGRSFTLLLRQDGTGSRTVTWPAVKWPSGAAPTLSTGASAIDMLAFVAVGATWFGFVAGKGMA